MSNAPVSYAKWSSSDLPKGLSLSESGLLTGKPTVSGSYTSHIQLRTNWGTTSKELSLTVSEPNYGVEITNDNSSAIAFYYYKSCSYTFNANYLVPSSESDITPTWTISGLPAGVSNSNLNANSLTISGYPTSTGNSTLRLTVTKGSYSASKNFTLSVTSDGKSISISTSSLPSGVRGEYYSTTLSVNNTTGDNTPYYNYTSGLPSGLSLGGWSGTISGYPSSAGSSTVGVYASAGGYKSATKNLTLSVSPQWPSWTTNPVTLNIAGFYSTSSGSYIFDLKSYGKYICNNQGGLISSYYFANTVGAASKGTTCYLMVTGYISYTQPASANYKGAFTYDINTGKLSFYYDSSSKIPPYQTTLSSKGFYLVLTAYDSTINTQSSAALNIRLTKS